MLDHTHRFHGLNSLTFAYRRGQTIRGGQLALKYVLNTRRQQFRAAVVVSRKVDKSAVVRNRIRRRIYEVLGKHQAGILQPYDLVFTVFTAALAEMPMTELERVVVAQLQKAHVLTPENHGRRAIVKREE